MENMSGERISTLRKLADRHSLNAGKSPSEQPWKPYYLCGLQHLDHFIRDFSKRRSVVYNPIVSITLLYARTSSNISSRMTLLREWQVDTGGIMRLVTSILASKLLVALGLFLPCIGLGQVPQIRDNPWSTYNRAAEERDDWFEAQVGFLSLYRSAPDSFPFVFDSVGNELLNMDALAGGGGKGFDGTLTMKRALGHTHPLDLQLRFFESRDMHSMYEIQSDPNVNFVFFSGLPADPENLYRIEYESNLQSGEINFGLPFSAKIRGLLGLRYIELEERFDIIDVVNSSSTGTTGFFSENDNDAFGGQLGLEGWVYTGQRLSVGSSLKWALLSNSVRGTAIATSGGSPIVSILADTESAQLFDLQLYANYWITDWLGFYGGYQGLYGTDFALGPTQSRNSSIFDPVSAVSYESSQWHGYRLGLSASW